MYPNGPICSVKHPLFRRIAVGLPSHGAFIVHARGGSGAGGCVRSILLGKGPLSIPFFARSSLMHKKAVRVAVDPMPAR